jgi:hypothetical protein
MTNVTVVTSSTDLLHMPPPPLKYAYALLVGIKQMKTLRRSMLVVVYYQWLIVVDIQMAHNSFSHSKQPLILIG